MATTRLISMHINKGKTIAQCLADRTNYSKNPEKTQGGQFISAYECDAATVDAEFLLSKREYRTLTGRTQKSNVIAYQIRQAFKPGEIDPETANKVGYELALKWTRGNHAFIVATHIDKAHIHNHIIYNSTALDCTWKFRDFKRSALALQKVSDRICLEHGLSIVENPKGKSNHYGKWLGENKKPSFQEKLRLTIDAVLVQKPIDFDAFIKLLTDAGYEYKPGKHSAFRAYGQARFTRLRSLGDDYTEDEIRAVIAGSKVHIPRRKHPIVKPQASERVNLLVDIQAKLQEGKGAGYQRWASIFNLKQMAQTMNYLSEHNLLEYSTLKEKSDAGTVRFNGLSTQIKVAEKRMAEITVLKTHIINYSKTRDIYTDYRKAGYSKKFLAEHEADIILHKAAKKAFDELGIKKLPTVKSLQSEYAALLSEKKSAYTEYRAARDEMRNLLSAKANIDKLLGYDEKDARAEDISVIH